jgi:hypothetical protein
MCGMTGQLSLESGQFAIAFAAPEHKRFSVAGMTEHGQRLEAIKAEYIAKRKDLLAVRKRYQEQDEWWIQPLRGVET